MPESTVQPDAVGESGGELRLRTLADSLSHAVIYQVRVEGEERRFLYVSQGVESIFGVSRSQALTDARLLYNAVMPNHRQILVEAEEKALRSGTRFEQEVPIIRPDGTTRWVQIVSVPGPKDDKGQIWDGVVLDITISRTAETRVRESERRLEIATNAAGIGIWDWNLLTNEMVYSRIAKEICGFPPDLPVTFDQVRAVTHPEDLPRTHSLALRSIDPAIREKEPYRYRILRADTGEVRWVLAHGEASFGEVDGEVRSLSYIGTIQDITNQKKAEDALTENAARLQLAVEAARMAVWEIDLDTDAITSSPELNRLYGLAEDARPTAEELRSRYAPGERERVELIGAEAAARGETQIQLEYKAVWPDGSEHWLLLRAQMAPPTATIRRRIIGVLIDITERKRAEEQLAVIARELQHRVKNSLAIVQTIASMSLRGKNDSEAAFEAFMGRLQALAAATDALTHREGRGASLREVIEKVIQPYREAGADPFALDGPDVTIPSEVTTAIGMALHELSTNAVKYGALSVASGRVTIDWAQEPSGNVVLHWEEQDGPAVSAPLRQGFGTRLLRRGLFRTGKLDLDFPVSGVTCRIEIAIPEGPGGGAQAG